MTTILRGAARQRRGCAAAATAAVAAAKKKFYFDLGVLLERRSDLHEPMTTLQGCFVSFCLVSFISF